MTDDVERVATWDASVSSLEAIRIQCRRLRSTAEGCRLAALLRRCAARRPRAAFEHTGKREGLRGDAQDPTHEHRDAIEPDHRQRAPLDDPLSSTLRVRRRKSASTGSEHA